MSTIPTPRRRPVSRAKRWIFVILALVLAYAAAEAVLTGLYITGRLAPSAVWVVRDAGTHPVYSFDPISGYRLSSVPTPQACFTPSGDLQATGTIVGNNLGYPGTRDLSPRRAGDAPRIAVFGDSFTAAQFLEVNWPTRAEQILAERGEPMELLNFAVDGGGIVNWWSILVRELAQREFEIDAVVFVIAVDDLSRGFFLRDDVVENGRTWLRFGRVPSLDPAALPKNLAEAERFLFPFRSALGVSPDEYQRKLSGQEPVRSPERFELYLAGSVAKLIFLRYFLPVGAAPGPIPFNLPMRSLMEEMSRTLAQRGIPALVVHLWTMPSAGGVAPEEDFPPATSAFSAILDAKYVDGSRAFAGLSEQDVRDCWLIGDAHWNQRGSDRFAGFMAKELSGWVRAASPSAPRPENQ